MCKHIAVTSLIFSVCAGAPFVDATPMACGPAATYKLLRMKVKTGASVTRTYAQLVVE
jgi:hypothetical protein